MEKGCNCASYNCDCYKPNNISPFKEEELLSNLWQIKAAFNSENVSIREDSKKRLDFVIEKLKNRGRKEL